jgi:hypothetical protein
LRRRAESVSSNGADMFHRSNRFMDFFCIRGMQGENRMKIAESIPRCAPVSGTGSANRD